MEAFLIHIGVNPTDAFAGFTGGLIAALVVSGPRPNLWSIFCSVVVGAGCGAYFGPLVPMWVPTWMNLKVGPGVSFGTGLAGMPICKGIIAAARRVRWGTRGDEI